MALLAFTFLFVAGNEIEGETLTVDDEGNAEYTKIQDAVDDAENGDRVYIFNGEYNESVDMTNKYITIEGESRDGAIIDDSSGSAAFSGYFETGAELIKFSRLTIHCPGVGIDLYFDHVPTTYNFILDNCTINVASTGINIGVDGWNNEGQFFIENSSISSCRNGILFGFDDETNTPIHIIDTEISFNNGYGIFLRDDDDGAISTLKISNSRIHHNNDSAIRAGLGIQDFLVESCEIYENTETSINAWAITDFKLTDSKIYSNGEDGAWLRVLNEVNISNNEIRDNTKMGIYLCPEERPIIEIYNNNFSGNRGGLDVEFEWTDYGWETVLNFETNTFFENEQYDSLIIDIRSWGDLQLSLNSTIKNNWFIEGNQGLIINYLQRFSVENCEFTDSEKGLRIGPDIRDASIKHCYFEKNENGICVDIGKDTGSVEISNNSFLGNTDGIYLNYTIENELPEIEAKYNDFSGNSNAIKVFVYSSDKGGYLLDANHNDITENTAYGILYTGDTRNTVKAQNNWWGATSGPYHSSSNPDGEGDEVSNNVNFNPWLESAVKTKSPPTLTITSPQNGTTVQWDITISGTAADEDSSIVKVEVRIDEGEWKEADGTADWSFTFNTTTLENGWHNISARAFDGESYSEIKTVEVEVDNPESEIKRPDFAITDEDINLLGPKEKGKTANLSVTVHNIGNQSGVVEVKLYLNMVLKESLIHNESVEIAKESIKTVVTKWTPLYKGDAEIIVVLEDKSQVAEENKDNNQASQTFSIGDEQTPGDNGDKDDDGDSPAFTSPVVVSATALGALVFFFRRRHGSRKI